MTENGTSWFELQNLRQTWRFCLKIRAKILRIGLWHNFKYIDEIIIHFRHICDVHILTENGTSWFELQNLRQTWRFCLKIRAKILRIGLWHNFKYIDETIIHFRHICDVHIMTENGTSWFELQNLRQKWRFCLKIVSYYVKNLHITEFT